jgi:signal peptidase I
MDSLNNNINQSPEQTKVTKKPRILSEFFDQIETFLIAIGVVFLLFSLATRICTVDGRSMENTLYHGEVLLVSDVFYTPERGDVIVFHQTGSYNEPIVKRIIATEGEWIDIKAENNKLVVTVYDENFENPIVLEEDYAAYKDYFVAESIHKYPIQIPEGKLFVMGDNRNHSTDSRFGAISFVDERRVLGRVILRLLPVDKFGNIG